MASFLSKNVIIKTQIISVYVGNIFIILSLFTIC